MRNSPMKLQVDPLRPLRRPMVGLVASVLLILLIVGRRPSDAAETKTTAQPSDAKKAAATPVAIAPGQLIPRSEAALRALQEVRFQLAADSDAALAEIEQDITDFAERSDRRWHSEPEMMRGLRSLQRLNDILREWSLDASQLDRWDRALTRRSQILVAQEHEVAQIY